VRIIYMLALFISFSVLNAQTTVNPDISVIGQLEGNYAGDALDLNGASVELVFQGYVNPFARVDVFLHKHMDGLPIEVEEAVLSIERGLPFGLALRAGKLRPDFGKINVQHLHTLPQIALPVPVGQLLGEEKWGASGLESSWLLPFPWYNNLSVAYLQNGISEHHHHTANSEESEEESPGAAISARYSTFFDLSSITHIETGLSTYRLLDGPDVNIFILDVKYKWRPDKYRSLFWQTELFHRNGYSHLDEGLLEEHPQINAGYMLVNYQFKKVWNTGAIADYSSNLDGAVYQSVGLFVGFSPAEETTVFRLLIKQEQHGEEDSQLQIQTQLLWSLGPHKAHQF